MILSYTNNELFINGKTLKFFQAPSKISKVVIPRDGLFIFKLEAYNDGNINYDELDGDECRNVFAVNDKGEVVWQIEKAPCENRTADGEVIPQSFTDVWISKEGTLKAFAPMGFCFDINVETGKLSNPRFTK